LLLFSKSIREDGNISLPALGTIVLNRILNPRIVFTLHNNNLALYAFIQLELGEVEHFQIVGNKLFVIL